MFEIFRLKSFHLMHEFGDKCVTSICYKEVSQNLKKVDGWVQRGFGFESMKKLYDVGYDTRSSKVS
jgi:hypothetical protein